MYRRFQKERFLSKVEFFVKTTIFQHNQKTLNDVNEGLLFFH